MKSTILFLLAFLIPCVAFGQTREIRITAKRAASTGIALTAYRANPLTLKVALDGTRPTATGLETITAEIRTSSTETDAPLAAVSIEAPTGAGPFSLSFTGAQLNQSLAGKSSAAFWLVVYSTDNAGVTLDVWHAGAFTLTEHGASQSEADAPNTGDRSVRTQAQLRAALAVAGEININLRTNVTITGAITIPEDKTITFGTSQLVAGAAAEIIFEGEVIASRRKIFSGFVAGEVTGPFGGVAYPEWWGLTDLHHDVAINCAVQSSPYLAGTGDGGVIVDLASRTYDVSAPINLTGSRSRLDGKGSISTHLSATSIWTPGTWEAATVTGWATVSGGNHAAIVWMGSGVSNASSYHTCISGIRINAYSAVLANPTRYVSGISSKGSVEECSSISHVLIENFSGCGIGFPCHTTTVDGSPVTPPAVLNGLKISNVWFLASTKSESMALYTTHWAYNCEIESYTCDLRLARANSSGAITAPALVMEYPDYAVVVGGITRLTGGNIEGARIGILVRQNAAPNTITINGLAVNNMMDRTNSAVYYDDGTSGKAPATSASNPSGAGYATDGNTDWYGYSAAVLIGGASEATPTNTSDRVNVDGVQCTGQLSYLIRDQVTLTHAKPFGHGLTPLVSGGQGCTGFRRGNIYTNSATAPYGVTGSTATNVIGPIF